ncbi:unnamed protein product [Phyllotreta striolata]|uniref:Chitin-binding type-2 domain-containing protein n=1 Tax=Phyllotreta striolata TaxID=444603 RepID=A0A9N9TPX0_PHYSR|nr:unnamed protein product [Phyllotreta striolata]
MVLFVFLVLIGTPHWSSQITTTHHDKPEESSISSMVTSITNKPLTQTERQKRLLPYVNFYHTNNNYYQPEKYPSKKPYRYQIEPNPVQIHYQPKAKYKYTPFREDNIVPGPFKPMVAKEAPQRIRIEYAETPNFGELYDKLATLKLQSQNYNLRRPTYVQIKRPDPKPQLYNNQEFVRPTTTNIETYTATNIDIPSPPEYPYDNNQRILPYSTTPRKPFIIIPANHPVLAQNQPDIPEYQYNQPQPQPTKNTINLSVILKHLQSTNILPKTLTPDNIDNSIKTLVKILDALRRQSKPSAVIAPQQEYLEDVQNEAGVDIGGQPGEGYSEEDTEEGGTPGKPGVDYPALASIPPTGFNCKTQRYKGFFGDPDTHCQVWHYCDLNGGQASFLCPNGTIFSQVALTCDWWYNVKCSTTAQLYVLNERLYKYIIPLSPKFPEDYTGPLVDKYLALKFQEMEEKMRKEKKGKGNNSSEEEDDSSEDNEDGVDESTEKANVVKFQGKETLDTVEADNN